jgi:integrase
MQHHAKSRLSTFFRWCMEEGLRDDNPYRDLWVKGGARHKSKWTHESFHAIRDALLPTVDESRWRRADGRLRDDVRAGLMLQCYLDLSFLLYQRTTEIRRLRYSQVLERERLIHFEPTKTARSSGAGRSIFSKSLRDLRVAEVTQMDLKIENGKVLAYRTRVQLSFKYES